jgi:hypothetical protein
MKDSVLTIRVPAATRRRLQALARREGRTLSAQAERLIERGLAGTASSTPRRRGIRPLAGALRGGIVPTLADFRAVREMMSNALVTKVDGRARSRR